MKIPTTLVLLCAAAGSLTAQTIVTEKNCDEVCDFVLPDKAEQRWRDIPWLPTFWEGVVEAQEEDRPILLWAMNGHPLALT